MKTLQWPLLMLILVLSITLTLLVLNGKKRNKLTARLRKYVTQDSSEPDVQTSGPVEESGPGPGRKFVASIGSPFSGRPNIQKWGTFLQEAGLTLKPEEYFAIRLIAAMSGFLVSILLGFKWYISLPVMVLGYWLPQQYVKRKRQKRLDRCSAQLVEALGAMANALRTGYSFLQTLQLISRETPDPLGTELSVMIRDIGIGLPLEEALLELQKRLPVKDLEMIITAILIQRTTGGNLAELIETMQDTMRGRERVKEELKTLTAQGKLSSWIITLLPVCLAIYLQLINPEYFSPMLNNPVGVILLVFGAISCMIGWLIIRKIIRIEV
jgi:tight adherence protein B